MTTIPVTGTIPTADSSLGKSCTRQVVYHYTLICLSASGTELGAWHGTTVGKHSC